MKVIRHIITVTLTLVLLIGIPLYATGAFNEMLYGMDSVSSATAIIDQPSGAYVVLINKTKHTDETLLIWKDFFEGKEIDFIFEDITAVVAAGDSAGEELAKSFMSRLPENQMKLRSEDATLMLSKADNGILDIIIMSKEAYEAYNGGTTEDNEDILVIKSEGK